MNFLDWMRLILGTGLLLFGLIFFVVEIIGIFKFRHVLMRMHAAAMGDTLGISVSLLGLMVLSGFNFTSVKIGLVIVFLWLASPVSSHLIAHLEAETNNELKNECELPEGEEWREKL